MKRYVPEFLLLLCLFTAAAIYYPGTHGYFQFDDTINILENSYIKIETLDIKSLSSAAYSGNAGFLKRPVSMVSFALNYYFNAFNPYYFKLTNIVIHLLNGIGIYTLSQLLLRALSAQSTVSIQARDNRWISLSIATAWLVHPLNLSGVLYVVQRMTSLAAFFMICGLISYVIGRARLLKGASGSGWLWVLASFIVFTPISMLCKENGALLPPCLLLTEIIFYRFRAPSLRTRNTLGAMFGVFVVLPFLFIVVYTALNPAWIMATYKIRDFTLVERCMTEARVIWFYIRLLIAPDVSQFGMYHDDIAISHGIFDPESTILAVLGLTLLTLSALLSLKRHPVWAYGILFFLLGHSMESSIIPLEIAHEHRNYFPDFGLLFIVFYYLLYPLQHKQSLNLRRGFALFLICMFGLITLERSITWGDPVLLKEKEVSRHPNSVRANIDIGEFYANIPPTSQDNADALYAKARAYLATAALLSPTDTLGLFGLIKLNLKNSRPLEDFWLPELEKRIRNAPFSSGTGNSIQYLNNCFIEKTCAVTPEMIEPLIVAGLQNTSISGPQKAQLLIVWSSFLYDAKQQGDEAAKFANLAAEVDPSNLEIQFRVATLLINIGKPADALKRIEIIRSKDKLNIYGQALNLLAASVQNIKK